MNRDIDLISVLVVVVVASVVAFTGIQVMGADFPTQDELDQTEQHFEEYCTAEYGEHADVYLANDAAYAEHNGFHCDYGSGQVHLNQVPDDVWEQYKAGEIPASEVTANLEAPPGLLPFPDRDTLWPAVFIAGSVAAVAYVVGRFRKHDE